VRGWFGYRGGDGPARLDDELAGLGRPLTVADRSCCCAARPAVTVIMPPAAGRPHPVDLLLCGRHYQAGRAALRAAGATVYDEAGVPVMTGGSEQPPARRGGRRLVLPVTPGSAHACQGHASRRR
jgi:hypothetical protein